MKKGTISRNIGLLMEYFGIRNEAQLTKQIGMAQATVNKLVSGVSADPRISTLMPIAEHFKLSLDTLVSEEPDFDISKGKKQPYLLVPLLSYHEIVDIYDQLDTLKRKNWPHWYPIPHQKSHSYYAVHLKSQQVSQPFTQDCVLTIQKTKDLQNNNYGIFKHLASNSINIKKIMLENGKQWLFPLESELPIVEFSAEQWTLLGMIQASTVIMAHGNFTPIGEQG